VLEVLAYGAVLGAVVPRLGLGALPRAHRIGVRLLFAGLLVAQLLGRNGWTFPLVEWGMYSRSPPAAPVYFRYALVLPDGGVRPFDVTRAFPSLSRRVLYLLARTGRDVGRGQGDVGAYEATLRAVGTATAKRAGVAATAVRVERCVLRVEGERPVSACGPFRDVVLEARDHAA